MTRYEQWKAEQPVLERLHEEIHRLAQIERFANNSIALEALQLVACWAMEEQVEVQ